MLFNVLPCVEQVGTSGLIRQNAQRLHAWQPVRTISESKAKHPSLAASSCSVRTPSSGVALEADHRKRPGDGAKKDGPQSKTWRLTSDIQTQLLPIPVWRRTSTDPDYVPRPGRTGKDSGTRRAVTSVCGWEVASALPGGLQVVATDTFSQPYSMLSRGETNPQVLISTCILSCCSCCNLAHRYCMPPDGTHHTQALTHSCSPTSTSTSHPHPHHIHTPTLIPAETPVAHPLQSQPRPLVGTRLAHDWVRCNIERVP